MTADDRLLRLALRLNATFSGICAAASLIAAAPLAGALGISDPAVLLGLGFNLAVFAAFLIWLSVRSRIAPGLVWAVIVADALWVVGTIPIVAGDLLTPLGDGVATGVALAVGAWAVLQTVGLRRALASQEAPSRVTA